ncbi:MAG: superoxide dismutase, Ni [Candidatus Levybacteria bacterium RIFCSPHIGHO2_02_FULL_40_18]|nr:MAG: superoxide dismutase, Ni [Candidatus Levybacteria bacterium RIFCSPHIGHO2_01_FULL_40_58]OGH26253.1 MAG: superoxide dismutase, Ni [Candidatus Levybacteria bacterium RIFCSPHIGHO2_02_FULL_40_18]OGH31212.1 MAG: superoxide dismutase, Ni [Candidatus Levybacteria bacterium RIFCSPHIGHO2_12_FULL_40_31]OGH39782.1 MAG: superoxide dismutase, Ni [Candidatus Levybacteria bacterium RIFCSPLOWO2_01_FULL_40_64]OGH49098.1 MAG: superoxide dismutase, Ni [Candidatus Levybacteria bacterium RIFCSPLOWO2_02_FULL_
MGALSYVLNLIPLPTVYAHCDIPCGVYDPTPAQIAAHTVLRMTQLLGEKKEEHDVSRIVHVKEKHGELVEEELGTLENDYFKPEHYEKFPELEKLLKSAVKLSITCRQNIDMDSAQKLLEETQKIAEIFYKTKDFEPVRIPSGYPTGGEIVSHK